MGEKIAPAAASAELPRMETPREALAQGVSPAPIRAASTPTPATSPANGHAAAIELNMYEFNPSTATDSAHYFLIGIDRDKHPYY